MRKQQCMLKSIISKGLRHAATLPHCTELSVLLSKPHVYVQSSNEFNLFNTSLSLCFFQAGLSDDIVLVFLCVCVCAGGGNV